MKQRPRVVYNDEGNLIEGMDYLIGLMFLPDHYVEVDFVNAPPEIVDYLKACMEREHKERKVNFVTGSGKTKMPQ